MSECPFPHPPATSEPVPARIAKLPVLRGFPVPWFVQMMPDGQYDFRVMDAQKLVRAVREGLCWTCGEKLGKFKTFVVGPMCGINRTSAEPPSHLECARYAATHCPFLTIPHMKRREKNMPEHNEMAGHGLKRNPGVTLLWTCTTYKPFSDGRGGMLIEIHDPTSIEWYSEGRQATREEIDESVAGGLPSLRGMCDQESTPAICAEAHKQLDAWIARFSKLLPEYLPS